MVYKDRLVTEYVPVQTPIAPALIADCPPTYALPAIGPVPLADIFTRLDAVEEALAICRGRLTAIRTIPLPMEQSH